MKLFLWWYRDSSFFLAIEINYNLSYNKIEGDKMKKSLNHIGMLILIIIFILFYFITTVLLDKRKISRETIETTPTSQEETSRSDEEAISIINTLYKDLKILYGVVNNKFTVNQDDTITIGSIIYKKITNFDEVMNPVFTENGKNKYMKDLSNYFAYTQDGYYLAGNLVNYQTYYFRGDSTNIYITSSTENEINGIIYEKRLGNNKNTLATIKVVNKNGTWLVDNVDILSAD